MGKENKAEFTKGNVEKIREIIQKLESIVPEVAENTCWIEKSRCQYGCRGSLSSAPVGYCVECHRFDYAVDNHELFEKIWDMWKEDLREKALETINKKAITVRRILNNLIEERKNKLGDRTYQVFRYFLGILDEDLNLGDIEILLTEKLNKLELTKKSAQIKLVAG